MASDIAIGIAVLAAAKKDDRVRRDEQARQQAEARHQRELALRKNHIAERRGKALDEVLEEMASLDRLRRLVANLRGEEISGSIGRVVGFLELAERRLASREAALSADGLEQRFEKNKLFGDDDDPRLPPAIWPLLSGCGTTHCGPAWRPTDFLKLCVGVIVGVGERTVDVCCFVRSAWIEPIGSLLGTTFPTGKKSLGFRAMREPVMRYLATSEDQQSATASHPKAAGSSPPAGVTRDANVPIGSARRR